MKEASAITCCVVDHGLHLPLALKLAETYDRVLYHTPWERDFPRVNDCVLGDGFERIERCDDIWTVKKDIDLFVFPDIQHAGLQLELESQGFPVWGSRQGDSLEINREKFHRVLAELGLKVPHYEVVVGMTALRECLYDAEDKYIKVSKYRGSMETFHWRNRAMDDGTLDQMAVRLGPVKEQVRFLVVDAIPTDIEVGGDTYNVRGQFPKSLIQGFEWKDKGYFGSFLAVADVPAQIVEINEAFAPLLKEYGYRNFWSAELRIKGDDTYFIDPCCRGPNPASGSQIELYGNLGEIIWQGAQGELVEPEPTAKFAVECVISGREPDCWTAAAFDAGVRPWVKAGHCCEVDGTLCFPPNECLGEVLGWLVATGDTPQATLKLVLERAKELPDGVSANTGALVDLLKEIDTAEAEGLAFTDQVMPEPELIVNAT